MTSCCVGIGFCRPVSTFDLCSVQVTQTSRLRWRPTRQGCILSNCRATWPLASPLHEQIVSIVTGLLLQGNYRDQDHHRYYSLQHYLLNDMLPPRIFGGALSEHIWPTIPYKCKSDIIISLLKDNILLPRNNRVSKACVVELISCCCLCCQRNW